jgi:drug/metabolite transporter (DMT)-like permease
MTTRRILSLGLIVAGVILLVLGINASESFSSEVSEAVQGAPSDKAIWLLVGGGLLALFGLFGLVRKAN